MSGKRISPKRTLSKIRLQVSRTGSPALNRARGETTRPFSYTVRFVQLNPPGTAPPMSSWWALRLTKARIAPSWNTGRTNSMSLTCVPVR